MSQHRSLRSKTKDTIHRSVLKRFERVKDIKDNEKWDEATSRIYGLPKQKIVKFKIKKEKSAEAKAASAEGAAPAAAASIDAKTAVKPDAGAKAKK